MVVDNRAHPPKKAWQRHNTLPSRGGLKGKTSWGWNAKFWAVYNLVNCISAKASSLEEALKPVETCIRAQPSPDRQEHLEAEQRKSSQPAVWTDRWPAYFWENSKPIMGKIEKISRNYLANTWSHDLAEQVSEAWEECLVSEAWEECFDSKVTRFLGFGKIMLIKILKCFYCCLALRVRRDQSRVTESYLEEPQPSATGFSIPTPATEGPDEGPFL